jgi:L-threonylcarbamoyladenylate synthase
LFFIWTWSKQCCCGDNRRVTTLRLKLDPATLGTAESAAKLEQAAAILCAGGTVAFPTETVYGLGAHALDPHAVARIFAAKQRPSWDPVIVHIADPAMLQQLVSAVPHAAENLIGAFWPGPLTLLLQRSAAVPDSVTAGRPLVGVRMPAHPVALALIRAAGIPIAAPSANRFGRISPTTAAHVLEDLDGRIDAILDAGPTQHGVESTVLDPSQDPIVIYRPGAVSIEQIRAFAGPAVLFEGSPTPSGSQPESLPSPGVGIRHYAPRARLVLIDSPLADLAEHLANSAGARVEERVGIMLPEGVEAPARAAAIYSWGDWQLPEQLAQRLYAGLRDLDARNCTVILCPLPPGEGIGAAIRDRLLKAAMPRDREQ